MQYLMCRMDGITCRWRMRPATPGVRSFRAFFSCADTRPVARRGAVAKPLLSLITISAGMVGSGEGRVARCSCWR